MNRIRNESGRAFAVAIYEMGHSNPARSFLITASEHPDLAEAEACVKRHFGAGLRVIGHRHESRMFIGGIFERPEDRIGIAVSLVEDFAGLDAYCAWCGQKCGRPIEAAHHLATCEAIHAYPVASDPRY